MTKNDIEFLYQLLKERGSKVNISHKKMPSYAQHRKFVLSKPYKKWYVIVCDNSKIGSIYLTDINEIGLHLKKEHNKDFIKKKVLSKLYKIDSKKRYFVNLNPKNKKSIKFFKSQGFSLIQHTYEYQRK